MMEKNLGIFSSGVIVGILLIVAIAIYSPFTTKLIGEPISMSKISGKIVIVEKLSPRNLAMVKSVNNDREKIVSGLPINIKKGDTVFIENGRVYKSAE